MRTGITLRMHVIAEDNSSAMQRTKLAVRSGVQQAYADAEPDTRIPMLINAMRLMPVLTTAAQDSARNAGYTGDVTVRLGIEQFDERRLDGLTIPAGYYPALVIRMGAAAGRNWWGLLDPRSAMLCASCNNDAIAADGAIVWDWSLQGVIDALRSWLLP